MRERGDEQHLGDEVAVGDRVERVLERAARSRGRGGRRRGRAGGSTRRARPPRAATRRRARDASRQRSTSRAERPDVGEQVVGEQDGLRPLEVRVAGQVGVADAIGARWSSVVWRARMSLGRAARPARGRRAAGRWRPGRCGCGRCGAWRPADPASSVTRRSTAVWMSSSLGSNSNVPPDSSASTVSSAARTRAASSAASMPVACEHPDVRARAGEVVGREPAVDGEAVGEGDERFGGAVAEAAVPERAAARRRSPVLLGWSLPAGEGLEPEAPEPHEPGGVLVAEAVGGVVGGELVVVEAVRGPAADRPRSGPARGAGAPPRSRAAGWTRRTRRGRARSGENQSPS